MRYESLLASRYIRAQKRQSIFTVISISAAIAIIAMMFVLYSVFMDCFRKTVYSSSPYHLALYGATGEQAEILRQEEHIKSVTLEQDDNGTATAYIMFSSDVGDRDNWLQKVSMQMGDWQQFRDSHEWNDTLMRIDCIGDGAHLWRLRIFCVFFIFAVMFALALRLVVDTAFEISSKERERQYGVLQSIGATPQQIVKIITLEGMRLSLIAIPFGLTAGVLLAFAMYKTMLAVGLADVFMDMSSDDLHLSFSVDLKMLFISAAVGIIWVFFSAYGVGMRVIRKSPMEAITARADNVEKVKKRALSGLLFGISGSIASRNARRQKKRFVITVLTLTVSMTLFAVFTTLTDTIERSISECLIDEKFEHGNDFSAAIGNRMKGISAEAAAQELADSGLFKDIGISQAQNLWTEDGENCCSAVYVNREAYAQIFGDNQPVSYDELVRTGGYIVNSAWEALLASPAENGTVDVFAERMVIPEDIKTADIKTILKEAKTERLPHTINIIDSFVPGDKYTSIAFFSAFKTYQKVKDEWFGESLWAPTADFSYNSEVCNYANNKKAEEWFDSHSDMIYLEESIYKEKCELHSIMTSIRTGVLVFNVLISLAALINLLNIISTGIANRRSELASLQCIGMTDKQLYRMAAIECMQFTMTAAVISAALCGAVILCTEHLLPTLLLSTYTEDNGSAREMTNSLVRLDHTAPFIRTALASVTAFAAGCITSFLMLRSQNKYSLSDQIRGTEFRTVIKKAGDN